MSEDVKKNVVYKLELCDNEYCYEGHDEKFMIGMFSTFDKAKKTAEYYLNHVQGFCEYDCRYDITEKEVIGTGSIDSVSWVSGWNENEWFDEIEIVESDCYLDIEEAQQQMTKLQQQFIRTEWCVSMYAVDTCHWTEGFVRV